MPAKIKRAIRPNADEINRKAIEAIEKDTENSSDKKENRPHQNYALNNLTNNVVPTISDSLEKKVEDLEALLQNANSQVAKLSQSKSDIDTGKLDALNAEKLALEAQISEISNYNEKLIKQSYTSIKPSLIKPFEYHDRAKYVSINDPDIINFAEELKRDGQEIPIAVRPLNDDSGFKYELVFGCRRHLASLLIEQEIPGYELLAFIDADITDFDAVKKMLVENENRKNIPALVRYINADKVISSGVMKASEYASLISMPTNSLSASTVLARFYLDHLIDDCPAPQLLSIKKISFVKTLFNNKPDAYAEKVEQARSQGLKNQKFLDYLLKGDDGFELSKRFSISVSKKKSGPITIPSLTEGETQKLISYLKSQFL